MVTDMRRWSDTELIVLNEHELDSDADMASVLSRSAVEVHAKRLELGLPVGRVLENLRKQAEAETETERRNAEVSDGSDRSCERR
jgi:hypothetical protein